MEIAGAILILLGSGAQTDLFRPIIASFAAISVLNEAFD